MQNTLRQSGITQQCSDRLAEMNRTRRGRLYALGIVLVGAAIAVWFGVPASMATVVSHRIYDRLSAVPARPVAVVLGAGVESDGVLTPVLQGRVDAAIALYHAGKVGTLLMSGDNGSVYYDEPTAMKLYAVAHGVPPQDIIRDYAGFHTFDTCYRAKYVFGIDRAIFVTQAFHLPRSLYLARSMGIDAVGFVAPDNMSASDVAYFRAREHPAMLKACMDLIADHKPRYPGPAELSISANTDPAR